VEQNQVTATIQADVAAVRAWIESHERRCGRRLSEQGLHLAKLVVHEDGQQASKDEQDGERRAASRAAVRGATKSDVRSAGLNLEAEKAEERGAEQVLDPSAISASPTPRRTVRHLVESIREILRFSSRSSCYHPWPTRAPALLDRGYV
jgi:hypothetical protein